MENQPDDVHPPALHYHTLNDRQFRVVSVESNGDLNSRINARLYIKDLDDLGKDGGIPYNAVSYTWSHDDLEHTIDVDDRPVKVSSSLHQFLNHMRSQPKDLEIPGNWTAMWIDQICINQADSEDKAQQLPLMRAIYEQTSTVIVWLGPAGDDGDLAMDLIRELWEVRRRSEVDSKDYLTCFTQSGIYDLDNPERLCQWQALAKFSKRRYWYRTWILQEATTRLENEFVLCGSKQCSIWAILRATNDLRGLVGQSLPYDFLVHHVETAAIMRISNFLLYRQPQSAAKLFSLLRMGRRTACIDPRDKVFAMLSFASDVYDYEDDPFLRPSYEEDAFAIYTFSPA